MGKVVTALMLSIVLSGAARAQSNPGMDEKQGAAFKKNLGIVASHLIATQRTMPDDKIKAIIQQNHLTDSEALGNLDGKESMNLEIHVVQALLDASKTDPIAKKLVDDFVALKLLKYAAPEDTAKTPASHA